MFWEISMLILTLLPYIVLVLFCILGIFAFIKYLKKRQ